MRLKGKIALISGASRNIGKTIALNFAHEGAHIVAVANKSGDELKQAAKECEALGVKALPLQADVSKSSDVNRMVGQAIEHFGRVDILVSAAGIRPNRPFWEISDEEWDNVLAVNLTATFYLARALAPGMMQQKSGNIIAIGGMSTMTAGLHRAAVGASKAGLHGLMRVLALELGPYGIRANEIIPGLIDTARMNPEWYPGGADLMRPGMGGESTPLRRKGTAQDIANAAIFLASDESAYTTGDRILCVGGAYL